MDGDSSRLPVGLEQSRLNTCDPPGDWSLDAWAPGSRLSSRDVTGLDLLRLG